MMASSTSPSSSSPLSSSSSSHRKLCGAIWIWMLFLLAALIQPISGGAVINIHFLRYAHPCTEDKILGMGGSKCDPQFTFCVDRVATDWAIDGCAYAFSGEGRHYQDHGVVNLAAQTVIGGNVPNPWKIKTPRILDVDNTGAYVVVIYRTRDDDTLGSDDHMLTDGTIIHHLPVYSSYNSKHYRAVTMTKHGHTLQLQIQIYCEGNYYGRDCTVLCVPQRDDIHGRYSCQPGTGNKICYPGWQNATANCLQDIDECKQEPCIRGTCHNYPGTYACQCPDFYKGKHCEVEVDPCEDNPCENGGECSLVEEPRDFNCSCNGPWEGKSCESWVDPCLEFPCYNEGECVNIGNNTEEFECNCTEWFNGTLCELEIPRPTTTTPTTTIVTGKGYTSGLRVNDEEKDGVKPWMVALICILLLIPLILLILCLVMRRRRRKKKEQVPVGLPPGDTVVVYGQDNLAFENTMYNDIHRNGNGVLRSQHSNGSIPPLPPTTPTDDDDFSAIKPVFDPNTLEQGGATGGYHDMDADGYVKPTSKEDEDDEKKVGIEPPVMRKQSERAQENPYADFKGLGRSQDKDEPHYQELDEVGLAVRELDERLDTEGDDDDDDDDIMTGPRPLSIVKGSATNDAVDVDDPMQNPALFKGFTGLQNESSTDAPAQNPYSDVPNNTPQNSIRRGENHYAEVPINTPKNSIKKDNPPLPPPRANSIPVQSPTEDPTEDEAGYASPTPSLTANTDPFAHKGSRYTKTPDTPVESRDPFAQDVPEDDDDFDVGLPDPSSGPLGGQHYAQPRNAGSEYDSPRNSTGRSTPEPIPANGSPAFSRASAKNKPSPYEVVTLSDGDHVSIDSMPLDSAPPPPPLTGPLDDTDHPTATAPPLSLRDGHNFDDDDDDDDDEKSDENNSQAKSNKEPVLYLENSLHDLEKDEPADGDADNVGAGKEPQLYLENTLFSPEAET